MTENKNGTLWRHAERGYLVATVQGVAPRTGEGGLSHAQATALAEELNRRQGHVVRVLHIVGKKSYEVDRYPAR